MATHRSCNKSALLAGRPLGASHLKLNEINYQRFEQKESDAFVIIIMRLDDERIIEIESYLTHFANDYGFSMADGELLSRPAAAHNIV